MVTNLWLVTGTGEVIALHADSMESASPKGRVAKNIPDHLNEPFHFTGLTLPCSISFDLRSIS
jgi:hypothetical protein